MWFLVPLAINALTIILYLIISNSQDRSGAGLVLFVLIFPAIFVNLIAWIIYLAIGITFGIR